MTRDCDAFRAYVRETLGDEVADAVDSPAGAHDFWLNRNGHGAGFWDGDWEKGDELSDASHTFGSCDIYVGDDGKLHVS